MNHLDSGNRIVERVLASDSKFRNDDRALTLAVWEAQGLTLTKAQRFLFYGVSDAQYIKRRRRALRVKYPANQFTEAWRYRQFGEVSEAYSQKLPNLVKARLQASERKERKWFKRKK